MRKAFSFIALAALAAGLSAVPAHAQPDPYQIFANARQFWLQQRYPQQLQYQVAVDVVEGGKERVQRYSSSYDAVKDVVDVDPTSDYERDHPTKPTGINFGFMGIALNKPLPPADFMGVPKLAPTYSFGMAPFVPAASPTPFDSAVLVDEIRKEFHDPNPHKTAQPSTPSGLREIGSVIAHNRDYSITLLGTETVDGHACYHLGLQPVRDPGRFRIREAWIDETTYAPWQLRNAFNFVYGPGTAVPWTIHFADVDGVHYISEERADKAMSVRGEIYTQATVRFESIIARASTPRPDLPGNMPDTLTEP